MAGLLIVERRRVHRLLPLNSQPSTINSRKTGCRGWIRTTTVAFKGRCPAVRRPGNAQARIANGRWQMADEGSVIGHWPLALAPKALVEPEVVATSPCRIKSPMPVCCGFDSEKETGALELWSDGVLIRTNPFPTLQHSIPKMAECRGLAPHARRRALVSTEARLARPVDIPNGSPSRSSAERRLVGVGGIAPPRLTVSETGLSAVRGEPHAVDWTER